MNITVYHSPSGGVGKTSIAIAKALKEARANKSVLLMDMATYGGVSFNLRDSNLRSGLNRVSALYYDDAGDIPTEELVLQLTEAGIKTYKEVKGLSTLYAAGAVKMDKLDYPHVTELMKAVRTLAYDEVIIDTSSDLHARNVALFEAADELVLVTTPDLESAWHLGSFLELLNDLYIPLQKVTGILNKYKSYSSYNPKETEAYLGIEFIARIPYKGSKWMEIGNRILKKDQVARARHYRALQKWLCERL